jgi:hypothetical protein
VKKLEILNKALISVLTDHTVEVTPGTPDYFGEPIDTDKGLAGMIPDRVTWDTDRGNWMWDGVLITLRILGVDTSKPA